MPFDFCVVGEHTQMAGRAGRRGLDSTGTVIIMANKNHPSRKMPPYLQLEQMLIGQTTKLQSQFKFSFCMILHLQTPQVPN